MHISIWLHLACMGMLALGQTLQILLVKIPSLKKKARAANVKYCFKDLWDEDWNLIMGTLVIGLSVSIGLTELAGRWPSVLEVVRWLYWMLGAFGSSIVMNKWGSYEAKIMQLLDVKANIADTLIGSTTNVKQAVETAKEVAGINVAPTPKTPS